VSGPLCYSSARAIGCRPDNQALRHRGHPRVEVQARSINWHLMPATKFDPKDIEGFLKLLPRKVESRTLRHAIATLWTSQDGR
jgi:hypothetical protein